LIALSLIPGLILALFSIFTIKFFIQHFLHTPDMLLALTIMQTVLSMLWWGWTEIPLVFREAIHKMLQRRSKGEDD